MADAAVVFIEYAAGASGIPSLFLKYQKEDEGARSMATGANMYEKELRFFADIAAEVDEEDQVLPAVLGTWSDPDRPNAESFCIALEDLSVKYDALNGADGITWEDACTLMVPVANWHAKYWQDDAFAAKHPWLRGAKSEARGESSVWFDDWVATFQTDKKGFWAKYTAHLFDGPDGAESWDAIDFSYEVRACYR
jgi:hypothetical protein